MRRNYLQLIGLLVVLALQGCAIGYDSILFATKSNMGVDIDSAPPNLEIAISRQEGVFEPVFEGGQTVPVMASFASQSGAFTKFFWGVNSTFSTGEAAYLMTKLYDEENPNATIPVYPKVTVSKKPTVKNIFGREKTEYINSDEVTVRPVLFGTDTSLGIKIKWSGATAQYPSAVHIGFKRKELTVAPLSLKKPGAAKVAEPAKDAKPAKGAEADQGPFEIDVPSLLATIETDVKADANANADLTYLQYFATGSAANNLSRQPAVRAAMLKRADPTQQIKIDTAIKGKQLRETNRALIKKIQSAQNAASPDKKGAIIAKAIELDLVDDKVNDDAGFAKSLADNSDSPSSTTAKLAILETFASGK